MDRVADVRANSIPHGRELVRARAGRSSGVSSVFKASGGRVGAYSYVLVSACVMSVVD